MSYVGGCEKDTKVPDSKETLCHLKYKYAVQVELF